ncbi:MAG: LURP-one-related family protein [Bdellovibrionota bacterium]
MKYEISQKALSIGDDFRVRDEAGNEAFYVDGKALTLRKQFTVLDPNGRHVAEVCQKWFAFTPTFTVMRNGILAATIYKRRFTWRQQFVIDIFGSNDYTIIGDFVGFEYTIRRGKRDVARVSKRFFSMTDSYGVDIQEGDPLLILCGVVVVDLVLHNQRK